MTKPIAAATNRFARNSHRHLDLLGPEPLERRRLLAGNVTVTFSDAGDLRITGDGADNQIFISQALNGNIVISAVVGSNTTVNGSGAIATPTVNGVVPDDIIINMRGGNDLVEMTNVNALDDVRVTMGGGNDLFGVKDVDINDDFRVTTAGGNDLVSIVDCNVGDIINGEGDLRVTTSGGDDAIYFGNCGNVGGNTTINSGTGNDGLFAAGGITGRFNVSMGGGADAAFFGSMAYGVTDSTVNLGGGDDAAVFTSTSKMYGGRLIGGGGNDVVGVAAGAGMAMDDAVEEISFNNPLADPAAVAAVLAFQIEYVGAGGSIFFVNC